MQNESRSFYETLRRAAWTTLRARLIVPYVLLTLLVAIVGTYIATRLVVSSERERFNNQLYEAARVAADGLVRRERAHLADLRLMAFTEDVPAALAEGDKAQLQARLLPIATNNGTQLVTALDRRGVEVLTLARNLNAAGIEYVSSDGADFSAFEPAARVLRGETDADGDKFIGFFTTQQGTFLVTAAPVRADDGQIVGALLVGSPLQGLLVELKTQSLADIILLDPAGRFIATTFAEPDEGRQVLELTPAAAQTAGTGPDRELTLFGRRFQLVDAALVIRNQTVGVLSAALAADYVVQAETTSRNIISAIFAVLTLAVILLGFVLAQGIARPLLRLRAASQAVAAGDLDQQTGVRREDEIGDLALAFDVMTRRLRERTQEAQRLYEATVESNRELEEALAQLRAAQQQLIQSEKVAAIGQLTAGIVHDVKNPLAIIRGLAELMDEDPSIDEANRKNLAVIRDNVKRASRIVNDLMTFARQSNLERSEGDLRNTVETVLRLTSYLAREARVNVITELPEQAVIATYDAQQIEQVLVNLIQNGVQAMPKGGTLRISVSRNGDAAAIAVQDTGVGIPPENLNRVFDPFFTTKPPGEGTGLGLSVSYGIVSSHGGRIDVQSTVGHGTTFTVILPLLSLELPGHDQGKTA